MKKTKKNLILLLTRARSNTKSNKFRQQKMTF